MKLTESVEKATPDSINAAIETNLRDVMRWSSPADAVCNTAGGVVVVKHDLGETPDIIIITPYVSASWWADQNDRNVWNERIVSFHASATGRYSVIVGVM